jgi:hypothetical protein
LEEIDITGDFPLEAVRERTRNFEFCLERIDDYFDKNSNLTCTVGTFPEKHSPDYCWGGCPGALQEAMHIVRGFYPNVDRKMAKVRYVVGKVNGPLHLDDDEKVIFAGDCTGWKGTLGNRKVQISGNYHSPPEVDENKTRSNDMLKKALQVLWVCFRNRRARYIHARGCPLSVGEHVHYLSAVGKIKNVNFAPRLLIPVNIAYWKMRFFRLVNRLFGD